MKTWLTAGAVLVAFIATQTTAMAAQKLRKNERYCLEASVGRDGGSQPLLCRFETMEQCLQSKTGNTDRCAENPAWGGRR